MISDNRKFDVFTEYHGSLVLVRPRTAAAREWITEHVLEPQYYDRALVVEPRFLDALVAGMIDDGLRVL